MHANPICFLRMGQNKCSWVKFLELKPCHLFSFMLLSFVIPILGVRDVYCEHFSRAYSRPLWPASWFDQLHGLTSILGNAQQLLIPFRPVPWLACPSNRAPAHVASSYHLSHISNRRPPLHLLCSLQPKQAGADASHVPLAELPIQDENCMLVSNSPTTSMQGKTARPTMSGASPTSIGTGAGVGGSMQALRGRLNESPTGRPPRSAFAAAEAGGAPFSPTESARGIRPMGSVDSEGGGAQPATTPSSKRRKLGFQEAVSPGDVAGAEQQLHGLPSPSASGAMQMARTLNGPYGKPPLMPSTSLRSPMLQRLLSAEALQVSMREEASLWHETAHMELYICRDRHRPHRIHVLFLCMYY